LLLVGGKVLRPSRQVKFSKGQVIDKEKTGKGRGEEVYLKQRIRDAAERGSTKVIRQQTVEDVQSHKAGPKPGN